MKKQKQTPALSDLKLNPDNPRTISERQREMLAKALKDVDWKPVKVSGPNPENLPVVTHEGVLKVGPVSLRVIQLSNGQRLVPCAELDRLFVSLNESE